MHMLFAAGLGTSCTLLMRVQGNVEYLFHINRAEGVDGNGGTGCKSTTHVNPHNEAHRTYVCTSANTLHIYVEYYTYSCERNKSSRNHQFQSHFNAKYAAKLIRYINI